MDMRKKPILLIVLCAALVLSWGMMATACSNQQETPAEEQPAEEPSAEEQPVEAPPVEATPATEQPTSGAAEQPADSSAAAEELPNPITESTPDEIMDKIGVEFRAPDEYADGAKYSLIGDTVAQMEYSMDSGKGPISVVYRVSKTSADDSLTISGDNNSYAKTKEVTLGGGQKVKVNTNDGTGPGLCLWYNENVVGGGVSASLSVNPIIQESELTDVASFFVDQESKGF
jgi:hypothetical protein